MTTQCTPIFKMQIAIWEGWMRLMLVGIGAYGHLWEQQAAILEHHHAWFRNGNVIPRGADWFDHYGKRNHDVDVEKV
ncbi:hypothetical protein [Telmatospirillum sp.]|uniref:hypothetical protein n=1 Tax=Telmatospirillum sp. TaxID=2079197 RepID=UPI00284E1463|nr:hypothetical protein [Telmatospirillum sp.]MDR3435482.1 hypothetical protein [Telmatospirillum sp.]